MKRSDFFIRLATGVLFLAVAAYIGVYFYNAHINTFVTTPAVSYTIEETLSANGYIIRTELVLPDYDSSLFPVVSEGEKVATGQAIAFEYSSREALETASEIRTIRLRIAQLGASGSGSEAARLNSVFDLSRAVSSRDLGRLDELSLNIETLVFSADQYSDTGLAALQERLDTLERRIAGVRTVNAPVSGTFSQVVDGFEHVAPENISDVSPAELTALFSSTPLGTGLGKLVTEFKWYYAAIMDADEASRLRVGQRMTVQFSGAYNSDAQMMIERVGRPEEGESVVLFSSDRSIHEITPLRQLRAEIVFNTVSGLRVPKEAIHIDDDGILFVFLQTGVRAERVDIEILREYGDVYLVRDGAETGSHLRAGSTIIVKANNLFNGKVVA